MRYRGVLLFGPPGAGKGTQGQILSYVPGLVHVACGDVFRSLSVGSELGRVFMEYSTRGELVPDEFTVELWEQHIDRKSLSGEFDPEHDILVLDGIPRNLAQARMLTEKLTVLGVVHMVTEDRQALHERIRRRALREGRYDDASEAVIDHRLKVYEAETAETLAFYPERIIRQVNADRTPLHVLADIASILDEVADASHEWELLDSKRT